MATYYLDYEGGSDAANGTTFANRWKTLTSGATAARIAPGDTVRIMGSPNPTSLGINGTWTDSPAYGNFKTVAISSSTNATPIAVTSATHGLSTGNYVFIQSHTVNTKANGIWKVTVTSGTTFTLNGSTGNGVGGATGTVKNYTNTVVELASAVTKTVASTGNIGEGRTAWTASANVTCTQGTTVLLKSGDVNDTIAVAAGFTTGKAAYKALGAVTDFSAYNQISFNIVQTSGTIGAASSLSLKLCSDTAGATAVNTINIPALSTTLSTNLTFTIDTGGALGASIQSIGFYVNTDNGAQTFMIDNIIACKDPTSADSLSLSSLIGKNTGTESWFSIASISDTRVMLSQNKNSLVAGLYGYTGTTETVTAYKRETIKFTVTTNGGVGLGTVQDSGTAGSLIAFEGGWDRTAMTTQNLESWFSSNAPGSIGLDATSKSYVSFNKMNFSELYTGIQFTTCTFMEIDNIHANNCYNSGISFATNSLNCKINTAYSVCNNSCVSGTPAISFASGSNFSSLNYAYAINGNGPQTPGAGVGGIGVSGTNSYVGTIVSCSDNSINILASGGNSIIDTIVTSKNSRMVNANTGSISLGNNVVVRNAGTISNSNGVSIYFSGAGSIIYNATTSGATSGGVLLSVNGTLRNCVIGESTEFITSTFTGQYTAYSEKHDGTADNHYLYNPYGVIRSDTTTRHTASGISWKLSPTTVNITDTNPLKLSIAKIACTANNLVTVKAWMQRSNTGLTMHLSCPGGQLAGVSSTVETSVTVAANTWEELTITFTPTEAGVIEVFAVAHGGTTYNGYVDDMTITQA